MPTPTLSLHPCNLAVLVGCLSRDPRRVDLPSGAHLLQLDVTVRDGAGPAATVPVAWFDPPARSSRLVAGREVVVVGEVRRRFFRAGPALASRTEVVAARVEPTSAPAGVRRALRDAADRLGRAAEGDLRPFPEVADTA